MTREFDAALRWAGWRALAAAAFNLRPAEAHALALMVRTPGRVVSLGTLAAFKGGAGSCHGVNGSRRGILKRIERVRARLADVGCAGAVEAVAAHRFAATQGFRISPANARRIEEALVFACGLDPERAAA